MSCLALIGSIVMIIGKPYLLKVKEIKAINEMPTLEEIPDWLRKHKDELLQLAIREGPARRAAAAKWRANRDGQEKGA